MCRSEDLKIREEPTLPNCRSEYLFMRRGWTLHHLPGTGLKPLLSPIHCRGTSRPLILDSMTERFDKAMPFRQRTKWPGICIGTAALEAVLGEIVQSPSHKGSSFCVGTTVANTIRLCVAWGGDRMIRRLRCSVLDESLYHVCIMVVQRWFRSLSSNA